MERSGTFDWFSLLDSLSNGTSGNTLVLEKLPSLLFDWFSLLDSLVKRYTGKHPGTGKITIGLRKSFVVCLTPLVKRYTLVHSGIGEITINAFDWFSLLDSLSNGTPGNTLVLE